MVDDDVLYLGLIWVWILQIVFMGAVVKISYEKYWFLPFSVKKLTKKRDRGTPENGDMQNPWETFVIEWIVILNMGILKKKEL